jgi:lipoprotein-anchoring transpeptidase ErfK/SrfK
VIAIVLALVGANLAAAQAPEAPAPVTDVLHTQVRLARAGFSTGEIDGRMGANTRHALSAFAKTRGLPPADTAAALVRLAREQNVDATATYRIAESDVAGPFTPDIPTDLVEQAALPSLSFRSPLEGLAERLRASPALLRQLNPGARFAAGEEIVAPNVAGSDPALVDGPFTIRVSRALSSLRVDGPDGQVVFYAPVTTGSQHDPLPLGEWTVKAVLWHPEFHYNPDLFWDADAAHSKATLPPGPNNPVGVVWIDLDREHYGLHGTPEPSRVGKAASHGCVRLTNWDAARLATMAHPGTRVIFEP